MVAIQDQRTTMLEVLTTETHGITTTTMTIGGTLGIMRTPGMTTTTTIGGTLEIMGIPGMTTTMIIGGTVEIMGTPGIQTPTTIGGITTVIGGNVANMSGWYPALWTSNVICTSIIVLLVVWI